MVDLYGKLVDKYTSPVDPIYGFLKEITRQVNCTCVVSEMAKRRMMLATNRQIIIPTLWTIELIIQEDIYMSSEFIV